MYSKDTTSKDKAKKGSIVVQSFSERLRLQLPRSIAKAMGKERAFIYLGLADTPNNRKLAEAKAQLAESDIVYERFDFTTENYKLNNKPTHLTVVEKPSNEIKIVFELWLKYFDFKRNGIKLKTVEKYENFASLFYKLGDLSLVV